MNISVRVPGGGWQTVQSRQAREWLKRSEFVHDYDAIETHPDRVEILDLAIPAFLGAVPRFRDLRRSTSTPQVKSWLTEIESALGAIPKETALWDWPETPQNRENLLALFNSVRVPSYALAQVSKLLHRKRPELLPVVDDQVRRAWQTPFKSHWRSEDYVRIVFDIGTELRNRMEVLRALKEMADELGRPWSQLSPLRLFDILSYQAAREQGPHE